MNKETYFKELNIIRESIPQEYRNSFDMQVIAQQKNPTIALLLSLFLGAMGIDRFYIGNIIIGIIKLLSVIILNIYGLILALIDLFLIIGSTRMRNIENAKIIANSFVKKVDNNSTSISPEKCENKWHNSEK